MVAELCCTPQNLQNLIPGTCDVTLYGGKKKKDFGDVCWYFKDLEMGKLVWILSGWAQNAITNIIVRRKQRKIWHTEEENSI